MPAALKARKKTIRKRTSPLNFRGPIHQKNATLKASQQDFFKDGTTSKNYPLVLCQQNIDPFEDVSPIKKFGDFGDFNCHVSSPEVFMGCSMYVRFN